MNGQDRMVTRSQDEVAPVVSDSTLASGSGFPAGGTSTPSSDLSAAFTMMAKIMLQAEDRAAKQEKRQEDRAAEQEKRQEERDKAEAERLSAQVELFERLKTEEAERMKLQLAAQQSWKEEQNRLKRIEGKISMAIRTFPKISSPAMLPGQLKNFAAVLQKVDATDKTLRERLPEVLTGAAASTYHNMGQLEFESFADLSKTFLEAAGITFSSAARSLVKPDLEQLKKLSAADLLCHIKSIADRLISGAGSVAETSSAICAMFLTAYGTNELGLGLAKCNPWKYEEITSAVYTSYEAAGSVLGSSGPLPRTLDVKQKQRCEHCGRTGHRAADCWSKPKRVLTCYACSKEGHISKNCPERQTSEGSSNKGANEKVAGGNSNGKKAWQKNCVIAETEDEVLDDHVMSIRVNDRKLRVLIDSGAMVSVMPPEVVREEDYTEKSTCLIDFEGREVGMRRVAMVKVEIGGKKYVERVAVSSHVGSTGILRLPLTDINLLSVVMSEFSRQRTLEVCAVQTRGETVRLEAEKKAENECLAEESINVTEPASGEGADISESSVVVLQEEECDINNDGQHSASTVVSESVEELSSIEEVADCSDYCIDWDSLQGGNEREELVKLTNDDKSLAVCKTLASKRERGYFWDKGILCNKYIDSGGDVVIRIVVPEPKRAFLCNLVHDRMGHQGHRKMRASMATRFTWPRIAGDLIDYVSSCTVCQTANKRGQAKAPLIERPLLSEPFEAMAVDIVGPFPLAKGKFRFLLTTCCLATRWPDVIPLKSVTAKAVAEGLLGIFGRCGLPYVLLCDNGSQFTGKLMSELSSILGVEVRHSSPYHPEGNGMLERIHSTLVAMIRKASEKNLDWAEQVPLALFALRQMTNRTTGLSPYELVWGHQMRTPLDVVYKGWVESTKSSLTLSAWAVKLADRLEMLKDLAFSNASRESTYRKTYYDRGKAVRMYNTGDFVWCRIAGRAGKLDDSWDGPYVVVRKLSDVNYCIKRENGKKEKNVHINLLKTCVKREVVGGVTVLATECDEPAKQSVNLSGDVNVDVLSAVNVVLEDFKDLLDGSTGVYTGDPLSVELVSGAVPISAKPYRIPDQVKPKVKEALDGLIAKGWVVESSSPWASPIVPVAKPDGSVRLCVNYKRVNESTLQKQFPIPHFEDLLGEVGQARVLSKMDLAKGYHQVPLDEGSQALTGFVTPWGCFQYTVLPFGLKNAPADFQRLMETVLRGCRSFALVYIDDVLVFSEKCCEHAAHVREVLLAIRKSGLKLNPVKCQWARSKVEFLGHVIGEGKVSVPEARVKSLRDFKTPVSRKDMRAALGTFGYYRKFVPEYASITTPLYHSTSTKAPSKVIWTPEMSSAFCELKSVIADVCCLFVPSQGDCFVLHTDASGRGLAGVLYVVRSGEQLPVAFWSRQLRGAELRYSATELEALAVVAAVEHFVPYLYGRSFDVVTDHAPLCALMTSPTLNRRLRGYMLRMMEFDLTITYRPGKDNLDADGLSRQAWSDRDVNGVWKSQEVAQEECSSQSLVGPGKKSCCSRPLGEVSATPI